MMKDKDKSKVEQLKSWREAIEGFRIDFGRGMNDMNELTYLIEQWASERGLHNGNPNKQVLKLGEEFGELCQAIAKRRKKATIKDAVGDMYVVMVILAMQYDLSIKECVRAAYEEIKDRRGKMIGGVFVKEEDLKNED